MSETLRGGARVTQVTMVCRCEEILDGEIAAVLASGSRTVDDVKRRTRAGMGICQGVFCMPVIAALVAQATEEPIEGVAPMTSRPPARPITLEALAGVSKEVTGYDAGREPDSEGQW